jgi:hypothetical protein
VIVDHDITAVCASAALSSAEPVSIGDQNLAVMLTGAQCPVVSVAMLPLES